MQRVRLADIPWDHWHSPAGTFEGFGQQVSLALGAVANAPLHRGGHPFDLEHGRLRPGKAPCPHHTHGAQWELYFITAGSGTVRYGHHRRPITAGEVVMHPPGEAHQLINTGDTDLHFLLVADNPSADWAFYPDSNKWNIAGHGTFHRHPTGYYVDEEPDAPTTPDRVTAPPVGPDEPLARFVRVADLTPVVQASPRGRFGSECFDISLALGGVRNQDATHGGHPFDVQIRRVAPGKTICPYHAHSAQSELFLVRSGRAAIRTADGVHLVEAGEAVFHPPGTAHQTSNPGPDPLELLIITDNPPFDSFVYPDSNKHGSRALGTWYRLTEVDYFDGEE